jgi:hypothetical protein
MKRRVRLRIEGKGEKFKTGVLGNMESSRKGVGDREKKNEKEWEGGQGMKRKREKRH